jgi:hypothetical protein
MRARKRPVEIEAWRNEAGREAAPEWMRAQHIRPVVGGRFEIDTLEGTMLAEVGDIIIRGVNGEVYPCKADIFAATYEVLP